MKGFTIYGRDFIIYGVDLRAYTNETGMWYKVYRVTPKRFPLAEPIALVQRSAIYCITKGFEI